MNNDIFNGDKIPTRLELYDEIDALTKENAQLKSGLEFIRDKLIEMRKEFAFHRSYELALHNKSEIYFMTLDQIDTDGYHFSYKLDDDSRHTICVKHTDLR